MGGEEANTLEDRSLAGEVTLVRFVGFSPLVAPERLLFLFPLQSAVERPRYVGVQEAVLWKELERVCPSI